MQHRLNITLFSALLCLLCAGVIVMTIERHSGLIRTQAAADSSPATAGGLIVPDAVAEARINERYGKLPLSFEANQGQQDSTVEFLSRGQGYTLFLTRTEAVLVLTRLGKLQQSGKTAGQMPESAIVRMALLGANAEPAIRGLDKLSGKSHYFIGNNPQGWHTGIPHYAKVHYRAVYPGIDLVYYGNQRQLEYDFIVSPGSDPKAIRLDFNGVDKMSIDAQGNLVLHTAQGEIKQHKPFIYQDIEGERKTVAGHYVLKDTHQVGFQVASYDAHKPLIIDPVLSYSSYLGGSADDTGRDIAVDGAGNAYVTGETFSTDFPATSGALDGFCGSNGTCNNGSDAFVTKLNAAGDALVYSTYLGGGGTDAGSGIAVDSAGSVYVAGATRSIDFPTTSGAFDTACGSDGACDNTDFAKFDVFVARLDASGSALMYSTYLGGNDNDYPEERDLSIAVGNPGEAYVTGSTRSTDFPTLVNAYQPDFGGGFADNFVARLDTLAAGAASLVYSTYLGGDKDDSVFGIAADGSGNAYVAGTTSSTDFPVRNAFQAAHGGGSTASFLDGFVTKLDTRASGDASLIYSTYLGGSGRENIFGLAVDSAGSAYVTGLTQSRNFPTTPGALNPGCGSVGTCGVSFDAFITKLNAAGNDLLYSTYFGGGDIDWGQGIAVDGDGNAYVAGITQSADFPTTVDAFDRTCNSCDSNRFDVFMAQLNAAGTALVYSTYLGGSASDRVGDIAVDGAGNVYITGETGSGNFPVLNPVQERSGGGLDAFVVKFAPFAGPMLQFSEPAYSVNEEDGSATIAVMRSGGSSEVVSVMYATRDGTAVANADYTPVSGRLEFGANENGPKFFSVPIIDDAAVESDETVIVTLSDAMGGAILGAQNTATLTIVDNDIAEQPPAPGTLQFSRADFSLREDQGPAMIAVTRSGGGDGAVSVRYATSNGTAEAGSDYSATSGIINFADGEIASKVFTVQISDDNDVEPDETVLLTLSDPTGGAALGSPQSAMLTIVNDDAEAGMEPGTLQFDKAAYSVGEAGGSAIITILRTGGNAGTISVNFATSNGTATAGSDYSAVNRTINFTDGDIIPKIITVPIANDTEVEDDETVNLRLSSPTGGATLGTPDTAVLTIVDNDTVMEPEPEPSSGGGGCSLQPHAAPDPTLSVILLLSAFYGLRRRLRPEP